MPIEIKTEIEINTSVEKVWKIITDFEHYSDWNPFITLIKGEPVPGNKITVRIEPPGASVNTFKPTILAYEPEKKLSWLGTLFFKGIFDGEHKLELMSNNKGTTTFKQSEKFTGALVPFFKKQLNDNTKRGFEAMNLKLRDLAEQ